MSIKPNNNHNSNARNNQERDVLDVRKSFKFANPSINTPAKSPTEFARKCSFGKEGENSMQDHEKENERDPDSKPAAMVQSPSVTKTKNFMSPTFSAVSKISPSPRKKILGERNEAIRASASLSEGKFHFYKTGSTDFSDEIGSKEDMVTPPCLKEPDKKVADFSSDVEKLEFEPDLVMLSPEVPIINAKASESVPEKCDMPNVESDTTTTTHGDDRSAPPYDPIVNFLSPRPQFLHYKPKSRNESDILNQGLRFEDGYSADSDTETNEEVQLEDTSSSASVATSPIEEKSLSPKLSSCPRCQQLDEKVEPKIRKRPTRFGGMWRVVCLIFLICLGFVAVYQENFALENFDGLLSKISFGAKEVNFNPLSYGNVTPWRKEEVVSRPAFDRNEEFVLRPSILPEEIDLETDDYEADIDEYLEFEREKLEENDVDVDSVIEGDVFAVEMMEDESYFTELENQEGEYDSSSEVHDEFQRDLKIDDQSTSFLPQGSQVHPQMTTVIDPSIEVQDDFQLEFKGDDQPLPPLPAAPEVQQQVMTTHELVPEASESLVVPEATDESLSQIDVANEVGFSPSKAAASLFIVFLLAATMFMVVKKSKKENSISAESSTYFSASSKIEPKEVDMMGDSCLSNISRFQKTSSYNLKGSNEAQSTDKSSKKNYKRDSFAASSYEYTSSPSYGSFTTYSILHSKQRDDEVVTPVRRSSRFRGKVASP